MGIIKDPTSWRAGFELGLAGFSFPYSKPHRKPTAYLYNGIRLPALPEWDRGVYPYVNIFKRTDAFITYDMYVAVADSKEMTVDSDGSAELLTEGKLYCFTRESGEWSDWAELAGTMPNSKLLWTNYDTYVYGSPDTLYMAASDPVPVYE